MTILVVAEHDNAALSAATARTITAAGQIGSEVVGLVAGSGCAAVASATAAIGGVSQVLLCDDARYEHFLAEPLAALVVSIAERFTHIVFPASTFGKNVMPRVAALLDVAPVSDVVAIRSADTFVRPIYAGNALATVRCEERIKLMTVRTSAFAAPEPASESVPISAIPAAGSTDVSAFVGRELTVSKRPDLGSARVVVSGGRGLQSAENFAMIETLADKLGAAIGATRAAVDAGFVPNDYQVGQTGKVVAPELYIAVGISGAIQHLAGMKDSRVIVAINKDADAPIFEVADYALVGDLFSILPELCAALE